MERTAGSSHVESPPDKKQIVRSTESEIGMRMSTEGSYMIDPPHTNANMDESKEMEDNKMEDVNQMESNEIAQLEEPKFRLANPFYQIKQQVVEAILFRSLEPVAERLILLAAAADMETKSSEWIRRRRSCLYFLYECGMEHFRSHQSLPRRGDLEEFETRWTLLMEDDEGNITDPPAGWSDHIESDKKNWCMPRSSLAAVTLPEQFSLNLAILIDEFSRCNRTQSSLKLQKRRKSVWKMVDELLLQMIGFSATIVRTAEPISKLGVRSFEHIADPWIHFNSHWIQIEIDTLAGFASRLKQLHDLILQSASDTGDKGILKSGLLQGIDQSVTDLADSTELYHQYLMLSPACDLHASGALVSLCRQFQSSECAAAEFSSRSLFPRIIQRSCIDVNSTHPTTSETILQLIMDDVVAKRAGTSPLIDLLRDDRNLCERLDLTLYDRYECHSSCIDSDSPTVHRWNGKFRDEYAEIPFISTNLRKSLQEAVHTVLPHPGLERLTLEFLSPALTPPILLQHRSN